jgi:hypothetical protein
MKGEHAVSFQGVRGQRQQARPFLGESLGYGAGIILRPRALMGHLLAPEMSLAIEVF